MDRLREEILATCLVSYNGYFHNGERANNKLDLDRLQLSNPALREKVIAGLGKMAMDFKPDFIVGVPNGANWLAEAVAIEIDVDCPVLEKSEDGRRMYFLDEIERDYCINNFRGVVVEDVSTHLTSVRQTLAVPEIGCRAVASIAVWDRGRDSERHGLEIPFVPLIKEHIPPILPADSLLWEFAE